jgi:hypothetical protein
MAAVHLQILSDLHLEAPAAYDVFEIPPKAPYLALLGDIGLIKDSRYLDFLSKQLFLFKIVFLLLGNHEPYDSEWAIVKQKIRDFEVAANTASAADQSGESGHFIFLDQTRFDLSRDVTILVCTLYSSILPEQTEHVSFGLNDFYRIDSWTTETHRAAHAADLEWLNRQVRAIEAEASAGQKRKIVVLTHHSPTVDSRASDQAHAGSKLSSGFSTDLRVQECWTYEMVKVWAFGHTHWNCDYVDEVGGNKKRVLTNQRGYYFQQSVGFDVEKVVEV